MEISTVVFDFGNVLIGWDPRRLYREDLKTDEAIDAFLAEVGFVEWNLELDRGRSWDEAVSELSTRYPHHAGRIRMFHDRWEDSITGLIEGSARIAEQLKAAGYRLVGLTNWSSEKFSLTRPRYKVFELFDDIIVSGDVRLIKPDPAIFKLLLQRTGVSAAECLFIDDSAANITSAAALGFKTVRFRGPEQLANDLRAAGIRLS